MKSLIIVLQQQPKRLTNQFLLIPRLTESLLKAWTYMDSSESYSVSDNDQVDQTGSEQQLKNVV